MPKKVVIVGAGPCGGWVAYHLAKAGFCVDVFEEHPVIGEPFQCTGILTSQIKELLDVTSVTLNSISKARIRCKDKSTEITMQNENLIIDRCAFDRMICEMAVSAGARFHTSHRALENTSNSISVKYVKTGEISEWVFDYLIGADGPLSTVAKNNGLYGDRQFWYGVQARAELPNDNAVEFFPHIGTFAWIVPENDKIVRIGLLAKSDGKRLFDELCKENKVGKIISIQGGVVPIYNHRVATQKGNIYLVGDAALQVKATTGGGIIQGMLASEALADSIINSKDYEKAWRKKIGLDLWLHLQMRNMMDRFKIAHWTEMVLIFSKPKNKEFLERHDRDSPKRFIAALALSEPRLWKFARFLF